MNKVYLSLGSNLGNKIENLRAACDQLQANLGEIKKKSKVYQTPPWGYASTSFFYNAVILIETKYAAKDTLLMIQSIEQKLGRAAKTKPTYEDRLIDIDIIDFNNIAILLKGLILPHERMHLRNFVILPLQEIAPNWRHPISGKAIAELSAKLSQNEEIEVVDTI